MIRESIVELLMQVPPEVQAIHHDLENWARWSCAPRRQGHCASAEHLYRPPTREHESSAREVDSLRALAVHRQVCRMPDRPRWLLHLWYVHRVPISAIRRKLAMHSDALPLELNRARKMLANRLRGGVGSASTI